MEIAPAASLIMAVTNGQGQGLASMGSIKQDAQAVQQVALMASQTMQSQPHLGNNLDTSA